MPRRNVVRNLLTIILFSFDIFRQCPAPDLSPEHMPLASQPFSDTIEDKQHEEEAEVDKCCDQCDGPGYGSQLQVSACTVDFGTCESVWVISTRA